MASRSIGNIYAELSLKDKMTSGLKKARKSLNEFGKSAGKGLGVSATAGIAAMSAGLLVGTKRTLNQTDELVDLSKQTGVAVGDMMKLQRAYEDGGRSATMTAKDIAKMQKSIVAGAEGSAGDDPFRRLGLSAKELLNLGPAEQFQKIGAAIMAMSNPAERTAKAMEIFGRGGMGLTTVFEGFDDAAVSLGRMPELAERFGEAMGEANDLIGRLPVKSDQFFTGFTAGIIGELLPGLQKTNEFDFTTLGENLGLELANALTVLTDGKAWELFKLYGQKAINSLTAGDTMNGIGAVLEMLKNPIDTWNARKPGESMFDAAFNLGNSLSVEVDDILSEEIAAIVESSRKKVKEGRDKLDASKQDVFSAADFALPPGLMESILAKQEESSRRIRRGSEDDMKDRRPDWESSSYDVNDYQKRGLALYGGSAQGPEKDQVTLLGQIRDILKKASTSGKLVWD